MSPSRERPSAGRTGLLVLLGGVLLVSSIGALGFAVPLLVVAALAALWANFFRLHRRRVAAFRRRSTAEVASFMGTTEDDAPVEISVSASGLRVHGPVSELWEEHDWGDLSTHHIRWNVLGRFGAARVRLCFHDGHAEEYTVNDPVRFDRVLTRRAP